MKVIRGLSRCMLMGIILLIALPVHGASKPGASDEKAPAVMTPSKASQASPVQPTQALPKGALSDLVITEIALDSACRLIVTVKNIGPGGVEPADFQRAIIKITPGGVRATELSMAKLAPGTAGLRPGAEIVLTTAIVLEESRLVSVEVDSRGAIAETNARNNRMDRKLSPRCAKAKDVPKGRPVKAVDAAGVRMIKPKRPAGPDSGGGDNLHFFSGETHGLAVLEPSRHRVYSQGSLVFVTWSDANPADEVDAETGSFVFVLRQEGSESCLTCGPEVGRVTVGDPEYAIQIPEYMTSGSDYFVRVYMADNPEVYGDSHVFSIGPAEEEAVLQLHEPPPCPEYVDPMHCHDNTRFRVDQPIGFTLRRSGDSAVIAEIVSAVLFSVHHSAPLVPMALTDNRNFTQAEFSWTPPPGTAVPVRYRIEIGYRFAHDAPDYIRHVNSEDIFLNPPWWEPDTSGRNQIVVTRPETGDTVFTGTSNQLWAEWRCEDCDDIGRLAYARVLLKGGEELQRIGPALSGGEVTPREWFSIFGYLSGADYQVRIELYRPDDEAGGLEMIASDTSDYFTILNNRLDPDGSQPLTLREPGAYEGTSFAIGTPMHIWWSHSPPASAEYRVRLALTRDATEGGGQWPIAADIPAAPNAMDWVVPDHIPPGSGYRILIERIDGAGASNSYIPFTIIP